MRAYDTSARGEPMGEKARKTILLVEDQALIAMSERILLERFGYDVKVAYSGEQAIAEFETDPAIDLALMDIDLGKGMDGTETARAILADRDVPVVFLSSHDEPDIVEKTESITSYGYIAKNASPTVLSASIKMAFKLFEAKAIIQETNRKLEATLAALQESKRYADRLLNVSAEIILATDLDGAITLCNDNGHRLLGYDPGELLGRNWIETGLAPDVRDEVRSFLDSLIDGADETLVPHENDVVCKDGGRKRILWHNTVLRDPAGAVIGVLSSGEDVSAYKELEERYSTIVEASPDNITLTDLQGRMLMYSPKALPMFGIEDGKSYVGTPVTDFMVPEDRPRAGANIGRMMRGEALGVEEYRGRRADGSTFDMEVNGEFIRDRNGRPRQILFIVRDITKRKRLIDKYRMLFDASPLGIALFEYGTGRILESNASLGRMLGYSAAEMLRRTIADITAPDHFGVSEERLKPLGTDGRIDAYTKEYVRKDGSRIPVSVNAALFVDPDRGKVVWGLIEDISERREAERKAAAALGEKELVLKEVHHRIKNNFTVIQSLLGMQAGEVADDASAEAFRSTEGRVRSMALLYEKLYESAGFVEASMRDYLPALARDVAANFPGSGAVTVDADVEDIVLDAKRLQALGILCNELVTNSMKHAFRGRGSGTIVVRAARKAERIVVTIGDDGTGIRETEAAGSPTGFGLTLVSMLARQLGAELRVERDGGTRTVLEFDA